MRGRRWILGLVGVVISCGGEKAPTLELSATCKIAHRRVKIQVTATSEAKIHIDFMGTDVSQDFVARGGKMNRAEPLEGLPSGPMRLMINAELGDQRLNTDCDVEIPVPLRLLAGGGLDEQHRYSRRPVELLASPGKAEVAVVLDDGRIQFDVQVGDAPVQTVAIVPGEKLEVGGMSSIVAITSPWTFEDFGAIKWPEVTSGFDWAAKMDPAHAPNRTIVVVYNNESRTWYARNTPEGIARLRDLEIVILVKRETNYLKSCQYRTTEISSHGGYRDLGVGTDGWTRQSAYVNAYAARTGEVLYTRNIDGPRPAAEVASCPKDGKDLPAGRTGQAVDQEDIEAAIEAALAAR